MKRIFTILATLALCVASTTAFAGIELGPLTIGGAMRVNYILGDYHSESNSSAPHRGSNGGNFELDVFRLNLDFAQNNWLGKAEYRWYDGYNFLHTGWVGYESEQIGHIEVGLNRVPFGVGPFGPANSWFFDQHYYMGFSDHMKLGAKLTRSFGNLTLDGGYYIRNMFNGRGDTSHSARYSYAVVEEDVLDVPGSYRETHQLNARAVYSVEKLKTDLGLSAQWTRLDARDNRAGNADAWAVSAHSSSTFGPVGLKLQLTSFDYNPKYRQTNGVQPPNSLVNMGAYDFAWPAASKGVIPSIALSYTITAPLPWIDTITFYNDYSVIVKKGSHEGRSLKNSALNVTGMSIARGNWLIYVDYALSNGNYFVGDKRDYYDGNSYAASTVGDFGANRNHKWKSRFNINFGYYF